MRVYIFCLLLSLTLPSSPLIFFKGWGWKGGEKSRSGKQLEPLDSYNSQVVSNLHSLHYCILTRFSWDFKSLKSGSEKFSLLLNRKKIKKLKPLFQERKIKISNLSFQQIMEFKQLGKYQLEQIR